MPTLDDDLLFSDEPDSGEPAPAAAGPCWRMLIVDDEPEVHSITRLVLADFVYKGRAADFLSAYSAAEARAILERERDIAVILLDVVMETDDAGLALVRHIRETLGNRHVRIILRTGQPGQAPERRVILDYDINDYKAKTQLTAQQLFTATVAALRSYEDIVALDTNRAGLEKIVAASSSLFRTQSLKLFATGVLTQLSALAGVGPNAILCVQRGLPGDDGGDFRVLAGSGRFEPLAGDPGAAIEEPVRRVLLDCLETRRNRYDARCCALYIRSPNDRENVVYLQSDRALSDLDRQLIEMFCSKISVGFDSLALIERIREAQDGLLTVLAETAEVWEAVSADLNLRIARIAEAIARRMRADGGEPGLFADGFPESVALAAILHDVGNVRVDRAILAKPGPLDETERAAMRAHAEEGAALLGRVDAALAVNGVLRLGIDIARAHHETWDGQGYPARLAGTAIPLAARIVAVADVYDALTRARPWRGPFTRAEALAMVRGEAGRRFDPAVVAAFLAVADTLPAA